MKTTLKKPTTTSGKIETLVLNTESIILDFPMEGDEICGPEYTFRVDAPEDVRSVEVSINQGAWRPCRRSSGYWWFDWMGFEPGPHQARARMHNIEGRVMTTLTRHFRVGNGRH